MVKPVETTDGSFTVFSDQYRETYHSIHGAQTESRHIFLEASGVADRLRSGKPTRVLEIGFGLGLNCLLTADLAAQFNAPLIFTSVENDLISVDTLRVLNYQSILETPDLVVQLLDALSCVSTSPKLDSTSTNPLLASTSTNPLLASTSTNPLLASTSTHPRSVNSDMRNSTGSRKLHDSVAFQLQKDIRIELLLGDGSQMDFPSNQYDAIYLDAFSPDTNPECWSLSIFEKLYKSLCSSGILTTYSSKGIVRRKLLEVGFSVSKRPGPPGKREFLVAHA